MKKRTLKGLETVMANLNKEVGAIERRTAKGVIQAAIIVIRATEKEPPKVPVRDGNLRASRFLVSSSGSQLVPGENVAGFKGGGAGDLEARHSSVISGAMAYAISSRIPVAVLGFSANYAPWVHEMDQATMWTRTGSGPKFLEAHLHNKRFEVLKEIGRNIRI